MCFSTDNLICVNQETKRRENFMEKKTVKIINPVQAGFYYKNGLKPLEITFTDRWVWIFDKKLSNPLFTRWLRNENQMTN